MARGNRFDQVGEPWRGSRRRAQLPTRVGAWYGHTMGDRDEALELLSRDFDAAYIEIGNTIGVLPYEGSAERVKGKPAAWLLWWKAAVAPLANEWATFKADQTGSRTGPLASYVGYGERFSTDWSTYDRWRDRIVELRAAAGKLGMKLTTPAPAALPTTPVESVEHAIKNAAGGVASFVKYAAYGGLVLGGVFVIAKTIEAVRDR